jgi:LemA protein
MLMIAIGVAFVLFAGSVTMMCVQIYNSLIEVKNQVSRAWANIDVILKQRHDEIPQLVQVIEQFTQYERSVITQVSDARAKYGSARSPDEKMKASSQMSIALQGVMAIGENYPELKSNSQFTQLESRISGLEEQLSDRREYYNEMVTILNTRIIQIPDIFFARLLNYQPEHLFEVSSGEKAMPNLKMNLPQDKITEQKAG